VVVTEALAFDYLPKAAIYHNTQSGRQQMQASQTHLVSAFLKIP